MWDDSRWVSDEGLRCYFSYRDRGGLGRLECYRRLLREPITPKASGSADAFSLTGCLERVAELLDVVKNAWRKQPARIPLART